MTAKTSLTTWYTRLTEPTPTITAVAERQFARVIATVFWCAFALMMFFFLLASFRALTTGSRLQIVYAIFDLVMMVGFAVAIHASRHGRARQAISHVSFVVTIILVGFTAFLDEPATEQVVYLYFLALPLFCAYVFVSRVCGLRMTALQLTSIILIALFDSTLPADLVMFGPFAMIAALAAFMFVYTTYIRATNTHQQRALAESEARYRAVVNDQKEMIYRIGGEFPHLVLFANRAFCKFVGQSEADILGKPLEDVLTNGDLAELKSSLRLLSKEQTHNRRQISSVVREGVKRYYEWNDRLLPNAETGGSEVQVVGRDITERKLAEQQALELRFQDARVSMLRDFVLGLSHEMRTPLSVISTSMYLLSHDGVADAQSGVVDRANTQLNAIKTLIDEVMMAVSLDDKESITLGRLDVNELLRTVIGQSTSAAQSGQIIYKSRLHEQPLMVMGASQELGLALHHLICNAITYTPAGGHVTVSIKTHEDKAIIEVRDNGVGIPPEKLETVFKYFYREEDARSKRGFGLGLPIAKRVAELHGGKLLLVSQPGEGTRCIMVLPLAVMPTPTPKPDLQLEPAFL